MNYIKQNFSDGQVLKASHLNHIEEGLEQMGASLVEIKQSDWSQADENKIDYIKNKPFETINLNLEYDGVVGDKYVVNNMLVRLTDKAYPMEHFKEGSVTALRNGQEQSLSGKQEMITMSGDSFWVFCEAVWVILEDMTISGMSFLKGTYIVAYPDNSLYASKVSLNFLKPIDEAYIPSTIPVIQSSQKGQAPIVKEVDAKGKPIEWETTIAVKSVNGIVPDENGEITIDVATTSDISSLQESINTLNGTGEGSVKHTVAESVAAIVANAPEDFNTLKEIADWISKDTLGTADLLQRMTSAEEEIAALDIQADWNQTDESAKDFILNKPVPMTDEEIDAICGGTLTLDITENALVDITTGIVYRIYVDDGKLSMKQVNESTSTERLVFVDTSTDIVYKVYVEDGKLHMMEVE